MLKRFWVNNFRNLLNVEFKPTGLNLLIGQNNSGKTNLSSAIYFLGLTSRLPLDNAIRSNIGDPWNIFNAYVKNVDDILEIEVSCVLPYNNYDIQYDYYLKLLINKDDINGKQQLILKEEVLKASGYGFDQTPLIENNDGTVKLLHEPNFINKKSLFPDVETFSPTDSTMLFRLFNLETNKCANIFKKYLQAWSYFNIEPWAIRFSDVLQGAPMFSNGANLNLMLFILHNENPRLEKKIIEALKLLEPKLDYFTYMSPKPDQIYFFMEDVNHNRFSPRSMSDGTLRYLAMIYLIYSAACSEDSNKIKPLYIIEEPENGIYVGHLRTLFEKIDPTGKCGQFIFTTHNPYFIDNFDNNLDGVHLMKYGNISSVLIKLDPDKIRRLLEKFPSLGDLHFREILS